MKNAKEWHRILIRSRQELVSNKQVTIVPCSSRDLCQWSILAFLKSWRAPDLGCFQESTSHTLMLARGSGSKGLDLFP